MSRPSAIAFAAIRSVVLAAMFAGPVSAQPAAGAANIPAGSYVMGTDEREVPALVARYRLPLRAAGVFASEVPSRQVRVGAFRLDRTEVTKQAFAAFLAARPQWRKDAVPSSSHNGQYLADWVNGSLPTGEGMRPVIFITWPAATAYCEWTGGRLPTDVEWEWAARGGLENPEFPWGNEPPTPQHANWNASGIGRADDVAKYAPNGYGLFDIAGNVWEFVSDRAPGDTPVRYQIRGGSYGGSPVNMRVRYRDTHPAGGAGDHVGFRCAY